MSWTIAREMGLNVGTMYFNNMRRKIHVCMYSHHSTCKQHVLMQLTACPHTTNNMSSYN